MKKPGKPLLLAAALATHLAPAVADPMKGAPVRTHPSQGDVEQVDGASARLFTGEDGVFVSMDTNGLEPGHVYTLLLAVINKPGQCPALPCTPKDVLGRSGIVKSDVGYAGGAVADDEGTAKFSHFQPVGSLQKGFFENGLSGTDGVEIHLVLNDHGPRIEGRVYEMLTSYRGGCSDESLPPPMPDTARAQGKPGPNSCAMVQFAQFIPDQPAS